MTEMKPPIKRMQGAQENWQCYRCWDRGVYFLADAKRFVRCTMCNSNFFDKRSGPELAEWHWPDEIAFSLLWSVPISGLRSDTLKRYGLDTYIETGKVPVDLIPKHERKVIA